MSNPETSPSAQPMYAGTTSRKKVGNTAYWFGRIVYWIFGWKVIGPVPDVKVCVTVGEPHHYNADLLFTLCASYITRLPIVFMIKDTVFWWPLGPFLRWLGGVPVNRSRKTTAVDQMASYLRQSERSYLVITPTGSRSNELWRTGFYWIAHRAGVPIFLCWIHYEEKTVGYGPLIYTTGDIEADFEKIRAFYREARGIEIDYKRGNEPEPRQDAAAAN